MIKCETIEEAPAKQKTVFEGFRKIDKDSKLFYKLPNEWTDIVADIDNLAELKVVEYLVRHTWGFGEYDQYKHITVDEFMHGRFKVDGVTRMDKGTGLKSDRSVKDGLKSAIGHGYIVCDVDARDKARIKKSYKLKMREVVSTPQQVDTTSQDTKIYPSDTQNLPLGSPDTTPRTEKDTSERHFEKDTSERKNDASEKTSNVSEKEESLHSFIHSSNSSLSQETKPEEKPAIVFSPEAEQIYRFAEDLDLVALKRDENHRKNCQTLAEKGITTLEQMRSLIAHCQRPGSFFADKTLNLKNLVNELPGWRQLQSRSKASGPSGISAGARTTASWLEEERARQQRIKDAEQTNGKRQLNFSLLMKDIAAKKKQEREQQNAS
jgi:hypothetical protein